MTIKSFCNLPLDNQLAHLKKSAILVHKIIKGNLVISLYWSNEFVYEVLSPKSSQKEFEIKCFERSKYVFS